MHVVPIRSAAKRMSILLVSVVALDAAAALLIAKPLMWCVRIPTLIPLLTPLVIFTQRAPTECERCSIADGSQSGPNKG